MVDDVDLGRTSELSGVRGEQANRSSTKYGNGIAGFKSRKVERKPASTEYVRNEEVIDQLRAVYRSVRCVARKRDWYQISLCMRYADVLRYVEILAFSKLEVNQPDNVH